MKQKLIELNPYHQEEIDKRNLPKNYAGDHGLFDAIDVGKLV